MRIRRLVLLRHGQTEYNAGSRMQGQLDTDLSDLGRDQAAAAAEVLAKRQPLLIVSSDLKRALETAIESGTLEDFTAPSDTLDRELAQLSAGQQVEADLARLRGELSGGTPPQQLEEGAPR